MTGDNAERKLTTIFAADVVGYGRLMAADEEATLGTLRDFRGVIFDLIEKHRGRLVGTAGDAVLAEFPSPVEAVRCAISIQEDLAIRNGELPDDSKMLFRIGINVGDVMVEEGDLFGDGVNVAARLEGIAPPGGICISGSTFEQVKNKLSIGFQDMGPQRVKNIPDPVSAFSLTPAAVSITPADDSARPARRRWLLPVAATIVILAIVVAGAAYWIRSGRAPKPLATFPTEFSTQSMNSRQIKALMAGARISGAATATGRNFVITLRPNGTALIEFDTPSRRRGGRSRDRGKWWTADNRFCMQYSSYGRGRRMCPTIAGTADGITAVRDDGTRLDWIIEKPN